MLTSSIAKNSIPIPNIFFGIMLMPRDSFPRQDQVSFKYLQS